MTSEEVERGERERRLLVPLARCALSWMWMISRRGQGSVFRAIVVELTDLTSVSLMARMG